MKSKRVVCCFLKSKRVVFLLDFGDSKMVLY